MGITSSRKTVRFEPGETQQHCRPGVGRDPGKNAERYARICLDCGLRRSDECRYRIFPATLVAWIGDTHRFKLTSPCVSSRRCESGCGSSSKASIDACSCNADGYCSQQKNNGATRRLSGFAIRCRMRQAAAEPNTPGCSSANPRAASIYSISGGFMPRAPNYKQEKKRREQAQKRKNAQEQLRKAERKNKGVQTEGAPQK